MFSCFNYKMFENYEFDKYYNLEKENYNKEKQILKEKLSKYI